MKAFVIETPNHGRFDVIRTSTEEEWLYARRGYVTASEIAVLAERNQKAWNSLREEKASGVPSFTGNAYTQWGHDREPFILDLMRDTVDPTIRNNDQLCVSKKWPKYAATPDGITVDGRILCQAKTSSKPMDPAHPPTRYYDQIQWELLVTGAEKCVLAVEENHNFHVVGTRFHEFLPDPHRQKELREIADRFISGGPAIPDDDEKISKLIDEWAAANKTLDGAKAEEQEARARVLEAVEGRPEKKFSSGTYTVTRVAERTQKRIDTQTLKKKYPEVWEECQKETVIKASLRSPKLIDVQA